jgi:DNA-binding NarL/FixJ family response regulator
VSIFPARKFLYVKASMKIKISIADDHPLIINGLKQILQNCVDMEILSTYTSGQQLLNGLHALQPDILLLDLQMPNGSGEEIAPLITRQYRLKIIVLTNQDSTYYLKTMMNYGVAGYILKTSVADTIIDAIRQVYQGHVYIDRLLKEKLVQESLQSQEQSDLPQLTRREKEVLELIASNYSSQEIADKLYLSKRTIDNHRLSLLLKLRVKNSATLVKKAMQLGLIS